MITNSVPLSVIQEANTLATSVEEQKRRSALLKNKNFYYSKQEADVVLFNSDVDVITCNYTYPIIKKRSSMLYTKPISREFIGDRKSVAFIDEFYLKVNINKFLLSCDIASELTGTGLVLVGRDEQGTPYLKLFDASEVTVIENEENPELADAVCLTSIVEKMTGNPKNPQIKKILKNQIWTDTKVTTYAGVGVTSEENPLGFLPFVTFKGEEVYNQYLGHAPATDIRKTNAIINQMLTHLGYIIKMQSGNPIVISGFQSGDSFFAHAGRAISLPAGATAESLRLTPQIKEASDFIDNMEKRIYEISSIPKVTIIGDDGSNSARQLSIKWFPILNLFDEKVTRFNQYELNLANMILKVAGLPELESIDIKYNKTNVVPSVFDVNMNELNIGLSTPIDMLMQNNPNLTEAEAEVIVRSNLEFNKLLQEGLNERTESTEPTTREY